MKDLQIAIADYYASQKSDADPKIRLRPSVETLPQSGNEEGDARLQTSDDKYYLFDSGEWNELDTGSDVSSGDIDFATDDELLEMLRQGEEEARG